MGTATPVYGTDEAGNVVPAGTLTVNADGTWTFTPAPGFTGDVPAVYTIADPDGLTDTATLTITIVPDLANETFANDDASVGLQGVAQTGNILANDDGSGRERPGRDPDRHERRRDARHGARGRDAADDHAGRHAHRHADGGPGDGGVRVAAGARVRGHGGGAVPGV